MTRKCADMLPSAMKSNPSLLIIEFELTTIAFASAFTRIHRSLRPALDRCAD